MLETGGYDSQWADVHMQPEQTLQAHRDLNGRWLLPIHNGTFDLAMHAWYEPFDRIYALAVAGGVELATPLIGERLSLTLPHAGKRWWLEAPLLAECAHRSMTGGQSGCTSGVVCAPGSARVCQALN
jgi:hypothetical protein